MKAALAFLALVASSSAAPLPTQKVCIANRAKWDEVFAGLSYACGQVGVDCAPINKGGALLHPDTPYAHGDYAFQQYYKAHEEGGEASCAFNGGAYLVDCIVDGVTCRAKATATGVQLKANIAYICADNNFADRCAPIQPNGTHYTPNNTRAAADFAMDLYYQTYRCAQPDTACDFSGTAEIVYANTTTALASADAKYDADAALAWMAAQGCANGTITNCPGGRLCTDAEFTARALAAAGLIKLDPNDASQAPYAAYEGFNLALSPGLIGFLERVGFTTGALTAFPKGAIAFTTAWAPGMPVFARGGGLCESHTPIVANGPHCANACDQYNARTVYLPPQ